MGLNLPLEATYGTLPERFYTKMAPTPVKDPSLLLINQGLAQALGLDAGALASADGLAVLAGNAVPVGADPLAQAYAGHQFGGFSPQLGDGRALLLGEVVDQDGARFDIQLKGSGPTPYSRMGDGRAWLGPVLREYIVSEAMAAFGVPTSRALAAVATGEPVLREAPMPGAVLTRVASSHIRVGTFEYFAARGDAEALARLTDYVIARHYPQATGAMDLLKAVVGRQAGLIAKWMGLGFIHGVMNTDNCQVAGETIDYGPCAFMDAYWPSKVFSSIDQHGRYAYDQQPHVCAWNLAQLASCLIPLMDGPEEAAIEEATQVIRGFGPTYEAAWLTTFRAKLGLDQPMDGDGALIRALLEAMAKGQADFTNTFRALGSDQARDQFTDPAAFDAWNAQYEARLAQEPDGVAQRRDAANPAVIPRNHRIEEAIQAAVAGDLAPSQRLLDALAQPFADDPRHADLRRPPTTGEEVRQTFCGT